MEESPYLQIYCNHNSKAKHLFLLHEAYAFASGLSLCSQISGVNIVERSSVNLWGVVYIYGLFIDYIIFSKIDNYNTNSLLYVIIISLLMPPLLLIYNPYGLYIRKTGHNPPPSLIFRKDTITICKWKLEIFCKDNLLA
jgi:hypothetical protein